MGNPKKDYRINEETRKRLDEAAARQQALINSPEYQETRVADIAKKQRMAMENPKGKARMLKALAIRRTQPEKELTD